MLYWYIPTNQTPDFTQIPPGFLLTSLFYFWTPPRIQTTLQLSSFSLSNFNNSSDFIFHTVLSSGEIFCRMSLSQRIGWLFSYDQNGIIGFQEEHQSKVKAYIVSTDFSALITWLRQYVPSFSTAVTIFPLPILYSLEVSH